MVSLDRLSIVLILSTSWVAGCATASPPAEDIRLEALCALTEVNGRLDVIPAGPGSLAVRIVTLDRAEALGQLDGINTLDSRGIAKVRVETPRPLLAIVLRLGETNPAISAALAWSPVPISIAVSSTHPDLEDLEKWAETHAVPLLIVESGDAVPPRALPKDEGLSLQGAKDLNDAFTDAVANAEQSGAAWIYGELNRPTLEAIHTLMARHGESIHGVGFEYITQPPTTPRWRRRCE